MQFLMRKFTGENGRQNCKKMYLSGKGASSRRKRSIKRGGGQRRVDLAGSEPAGSATADPDSLIALDEALERLARIDNRKAALVKLRYFAGLTIEQTAQSLDISPASAKRLWTYARAWLVREMDGAP